MGYIELSVRRHAHAELCDMTLHHMSAILLAVIRVLVPELELFVCFHGCPATEQDSAQELPLEGVFRLKSSHSPDKSFCTELAERVLQV